MGSQYHWNRLGLLSLPNSRPEWAKTHMMMPTPEYLEDGRVRVYFGTRNSANQSSIARCFLAEDKGRIVLDGNPELVLSPGRLGCFDDNGVLPSCVIRFGSETFLFYVGFRPGGTTRMELFGGLAVESKPGMGFQRYSEAPIIGRQDESPLLNTAPWVVYNGGEWVMYFVAGLEWLHRDLPRYHIRQARSRDLLSWNLGRHVAIDLEPKENALARPVVTPLAGGGWHMWFSAKGENYAPHRAVSEDGFSWKRLGIEEDLVDTSGFGDEMQEYVAPFSLHQSMYLLYNGNNYGREGILVAKEKLT